MSVAISVIVRNILAFKSLAVTIFLFFSLGCSSLNTRGPYSSGFSLRPYKEITLENGLRIISIKDNSLPRVSMGLMVFSGTAHDSKDKQGVNFFTAHLLSKSTQDKNASQLADAFAFLGTSFSKDIQDGHAYFSTNGLSRDEDKLFELFYEVMMYPAFSKNEIKRLKKQVKSQILTRSDNPRDFAQTNFLRYIYGDHPYGYSPFGSKKTVNALKKKDIVRNYLRYYRPNNSVMYVAGNFSKDFFEKVKTKMSKWEKRDIPAVSLPQPSQSKGLKIRLIDKEGLQQSQIRIGHLSIKRENKDYFPLRMAIRVLGGGFASRLNQKIRDDLGLTYSIYSYLNAKKNSGHFTISTFTRNEKVKETVKESLNIYEKMFKEGVEQVELKDNKALMVGQFPQIVETSDRLALNLLILRNYGVGDDYLHNYLKNVNALTLNQINSIIKAEFDPQNIKVLIYADARKVLSQLKELGEVEVIPYTDVL